MIVSQDKDSVFGQRRFMFDECQEKLYNARLYQSVPQTDTGG